MAKQKILLVDDELFTIRVVTEILEINGYEVLAVHNGKDAINVSKDMQPDLILMDYNMPGMDGLTSAAAIKADKDTAHIPILMLTADNSLDTIGKAYNLKVAGYVVKDLVPMMLVERITSVLKGKKKS